MSIITCDGLDIFENDITAVLVNVFAGLPPVYPGWAVNCTKPSPVWLLFLNGDVFVIQPEPSKYTNSHLQIPVFRLQFTCI